MTEKIGNITLDLTAYPGKDLYSDGLIEQKMLQIAKECPPDQMNEVIAREKSWPILYHMSPVRENIVRSLPITKKDRVLEIGAGCGAVTGQLSFMAGHVTCIDLSRQRSLINAYRHQDRDNISILVGNFQDIEPNLNEKYDVITLIGVLEYAGLYIGTGRNASGQDPAAPYRVFLEKIRRHLTDGGLLVTAIENRLGMKYWAGCREDHTGHFFEGLENYPNPGASAHTFSRQELEALFESAGMADNSFYYPYPDYKLPEMIFSDEYLPQKGELNRNLRNFDRDRMVLFNESAVYDSLTFSGLFPEFSNSFLVLSRKQAAAPREHLVYAKYSAQRGPDFAIQTDILQETDGNRTVRKSAVYPRGNAHVQQIRRSGQQLGRLFENTILSVNQVLPQEDAGNKDGSRSPAADQARESVRLAYIGPAQGRSQTLQARMSLLWEQGKQQEALALLHTLTELIRSRAAEPFSVTEPFTQIFGLKEYAWDDRSLPVTDLDMIPENILLSEDSEKGRWTLIDYEWTYAFPVPVRFVIWRACHYFFAGMTGDRAQPSWYLQEGFTDGELTLFRQMERSWQEHVREGVEDLQDLYGLISPGARYPVEELFPDTAGHGASYWGRLTSPDEKVSINVPFAADSDGSFTARLPVGKCTGSAGAGDGSESGAAAGSVHAPADGQTSSAGPAGADLRAKWHPLGNALCRIEITRVDAPGAVLFRPVNGFATAQGDEFWTADPVYELTGLTAGTDVITVYGNVQRINLYEILPQLNQIRRERDADAAELERLRAWVSATRGTKAFKAAEVFRRVRNFIMARVRGTWLFRDRSAGTKQYQSWLRTHLASREMLDAQKRTHLPQEVKISVLVPVYRTEETYLKQMIESVIGQSYGNWELCIADGSVDEGKTAALIKPYTQQDSRIRLQVLTENEGIAGNTNRAADLASGDYLCLLDHDDQLAPEALFEVARAIYETGADVLYSDEDKINRDGTQHFSPNLKPDFSPDLLRSHNYITHLFVVKRSLFQEAGPFRSEYDGAQDYDLILRCTEKAQKIYHIPRILYFWRSYSGSTSENPKSKEYAYEAGRRAVEDHVRRLGMKASVSRTPYWGLYHVRYAVPEEAFVSIIIPNKDHVRDLERCITSIEERSAFRKFEILIIENNSVKAQTAEYYDAVQKQYENVRVLRWPGKGFNYSSINNYGAVMARGDYLLFLNNDTELIEPDSIGEMAGICARPEVGCVGAKLLYGNDTVQHAGIILGPGGFAGHVFTGIKKNSPGFMMRPLVTCNYSAVTGACLMTRKDIFRQEGGFSEDLAVALNDVDLCLKFRKEGYLVVYTPYSLWHHYESRSRGYEDTPEKKARFEREVALFCSRWAQMLEKPDPYYHPCFDKNKAPFTL